MHYVEVITSPQIVRDVLLCQHLTHLHNKNAARAWDILSVSMRIDFVALVGYCVASVELVVVEFRTRDE